MSGEMAVALPTRLLSLTWQVSRGSPHHPEEHATPRATAQDGRAGLSAARRGLRYVIYLRAKSV